MTHAGMDGISLMRVILAFVAVSGLIALLGFVLKYIKMRGFVMPGAPIKARRLQLIESLMIDPRRRLAIVRCDEAEHLLLLGVNEDIVVQANLVADSTGMRMKSGA